MSFPQTVVGAIYLLRSITSCLYYKLQTFPHITICIFTFLWCFFATQKLSQCHLMKNVVSIFPIYLRCHFYHITKLQVLGYTWTFCPVPFICLSTPGRINSLYMKGIKVYSPKTWHFGIRIVLSGKQLAPLPSPFLSKSKTLISICVSLSCTRNKQEDNSVTGDSSSVKKASGFWPRWRRR